MPRLIQSFDAERQGVGTQPHGIRGTTRCCRPNKFCLLECPL